MAEATAWTGARETALPAWACWSAAGAAAPWSVGVEEEVALSHPVDGRMANLASEALVGLRGRGVDASAETHACVIECKTRAHPTVAELGRELRALRSAAAGVLVDELGLDVVAAGLHPLALASQVRLSAGRHQREVAATTRALARREPTMALHVHVGVPDADAAVRGLDGLRADLPVLLAVASSSPFWHGEDSGFASFRVPLFSGFPRTGPPRWFGSYEAYVEDVERLLRVRAIPDPGFLWWDARLRPALGTIEVRVMDAQAVLGSVTAIAALVQCLVRRCAELAPSSEPVTRDLLDENRFLAARDGMRAALISPSGRRRVAARVVLERLLDGCDAVAPALGCEAELAAVAALAGAPADEQMREHAEREGVASLPRWLSGRYDASDSRSRRAERQAQRRSASVPACTATSTIAAAPTTIHSHPETTFDDTDHMTA
jgi:carboxylate-amine ligase